jgi:hypothetical protein
MSTIPLYCPGCGTKTNYKGGIPTHNELLECVKCKESFRVFDWLWVPLKDVTEIWKKTYPERDCPYPMKGIRTC